MPSSWFRIMRATSFMASAFERMTFVRHCLSIWRTTWRCLWLRISRRSSRYCQARAACLLQAGALGGQVFQQGIKFGTRAVAELISVFEQLPAQSLEFGVVLLCKVPQCDSISYSALPVKKELWASY